MYLFILEYLKKKLLFVHCYVFITKLLSFIVGVFFPSQNAMVSFKELCGLTPAANMKQCILTVSSWLMNSERSLRVTVDLSETYPTMEAQGPVPELLRKVLNAYDMVNNLHAQERVDVPACDAFKRTEVVIQQVNLKCFCG